MRSHQSDDLTHPDAACNISWPPTQESSRLAQEIRGSSSSSGSPAEDDTASRPAQPWLQAAKRGDRHQQDTSSSSAADHLGCSPSAQGHKRKRGCRGHGAQQRRAQQRSQQAAASQGQRAAGRRSDPEDLNSIAAAIRAQCEAVTAMTTAVQQLAKQVSNFLFAQRQPHQQRQPQRQDTNVGKTSELRKKGEGEWKMVEDKARAKLDEIRTVREQQMQAKLADLSQSQREASEERWKKEIAHQFTSVDAELATAMREERQYEKCDYRRTQCKSLISLITQYNTISGGQYDSLFLGYKESPGCEKYTFDQYGNTSSVHEFLVDPGKFWSYDLLRSKFYGERPL
jgi:hypothetical protein